MFAGPSAQRLLSHLEASAKSNSSNGSFLTKEILIRAGSEDLCVVDLVQEAKAGEAAAWCYDAGTGNLSKVLTRSEMRSDRRKRADAADEFGTGRVQNGSRRK